MKNLIVLAASLLIILGGCSTTPSEREIEVQNGANGRKQPLPMIVVNPGSAIHTSVINPVIVFAEDISINITESETFVTFTDAFSGNRTTVQGNIDMTLLNPTDYKIIDWRSSK